VSSGTAALHLMCLAAGIGPGDEVIVPSLTFVATANAIRYTGATPVFADIAGMTEPWLAAGACEAALTSRTRAIMAMAYGGHPGQLTALERLAQREGLALIEDAAHAAGSSVDARRVGTIGLVGAFSFFSNKNLAVGEGGMLVTDDDELAARARLLRSHGMTTLSWDRHRGRATGYDVVELGFNYRLDEPRAAFARRRLERLDDENRARGRVEERYRQRLGALAGVQLTAAAEPGQTSAHHLLTVVLDDSVEREAVRSAMAARGVQTSVHYPPVHGFSIYADGSARLPLTEAYAAHTLTLPLFPHLTEAQVDLVVEALSAALPAGR
jgi:dTDP-4-amino-4,6-dideoxygalactose transaminase